MADEDKPKSFWRRLKDKLTGKGPDEQPTDEVQRQPQHELQDEAQPEATAPRAVDQTPEQPPSLPTPAKDGAPSVLSTSELKTDNVGRVYAQALLELAQDAGIVDTLADEVRQLLPIIAVGGELHLLLTNPAIGDEQRAAVVKAVFEGKITLLLYNLLRLLGDKGRLGSLPQVAAGFLMAVAELRGQIEVVAFVASEMDADSARRVADQIGKTLGKTVTLRQKIDPALIGGLKLKIGDKLIDASVASQLRNMKNQMIAAGRS